MPGSLKHTLPLGFSHPELGAAGAGCREVIVFKCVGDQGEGHRSSLESAGYTRFNQQLHFLPAPIVFHLIKCIL